MKWKWFVSAMLCLVPCFSVAATRHYYIAAEDVSWNFAPSGRDLIDSRPIPAPWSAQTVWPKSRFVEYTDATFSQKKAQPEWLGILGPIIRAEVGDEVIVDFSTADEFLTVSILTGCATTKRMRVLSTCPRQRVRRLLREQNLLITGWQMRAVALLKAS